MSGRAVIDCFWDGQVFKPVNPYMVRRAAKEFTEGEIVHLADQPERSLKSHAFYFASVNTAWRNLPAVDSERFPSPSHLRRYALIKAGFFNSQSMPCGSESAARRFAAFVRPMDEFAVVDVRGSVVTVYTAKSQSVKAMGREEFNRSKEAVLEVLADMIGVTRADLEKSEQPPPAYSQADYMGAG